MPSTRLCLSAAVEATAKALGLSFDSSSGVHKLVQGSMDITMANLASSYATIAAQGRRASRHSVTLIKDNDGRTVFKHPAYAAYGVSGCASHALNRLQRAATGKRYTRREAHHQHDAVTPSSAVQACLQSAGKYDADTQHAKGAILRRRLHGSGVHPSSRANRLVVCWFHTITGDSYMGWL
jgi:membrane carboxypeptidase/penicillin-binding protein